MYRVKIYTKTNTSGLDAVVFAPKEGPYPLSRTGAQGDVDISIIHRPYKVDVHPDDHDEQNKLAVDQHRGYVEDLKAVSETGDVLFEVEGKTMIEGSLEGIVFTIPESDANSDVGFFPGR